MIGRIAALYRHPIKGFTPERLATVELAARTHFPCDRLYAVEAGPSGYDPAAPRFISKSRFTVLTNTPALARARTAYDAATGRLSVTREGEAAFVADLATDAGRVEFAAWLTGFLDGEVRGPLRVLQAAAADRFMDDVAGRVSVVNLESVRDLAHRLGVEIDPLRFRANLYVEGWPPWSELEALSGSTMRLGGVVAEIVKPIKRCAATHVDTRTGVADLDVVGALRACYGHIFCGLYLDIASSGRLSEGDPAVLPSRTGRLSQPATSQLGPATRMRAAG